MNILEKYLLRASGERNKQAQSVVESVLFGTIDFMKKETSFSIDWETKNPEQKLQFMESLQSQIQRSMENF